MNKKFQVAVIGYAGKEEYKGSGGASKKLMHQAEEIGKRLALSGVIVVTGGKSGIMLAAAKGAKGASGITVGIVKGNNRFVSNSYIDVEVITGMVADGMDELLITLMADAFIVLGGGAGTLQEIALAYRNDKPIVVLEGSGGWAQRVQDEYLDERKRLRIISVKTPREAVQKILRLLKR